MKAKREYIYYKAINFTANGLNEFSVCLYLTYFVYAIYNVIIIMYLV